MPHVQEARLLGTADEPALADDLEGESGFELVGYVLTGTQITIFGNRTDLGLLLLLLLRLPATATAAAPDNQREHQRHGRRQQ